MDKNELKKLLRRLEVRPSRKLGQNFLCSEEAARCIVKQLAPSREDAVIEIGPGTGALTEHLAGSVRRLVAVEKDARLAGHLRERFGGEGVEVREADALEFDLRPWYAERPLKLIGNLPYSTGGEIIRLFLGHGSPVDRAIVMVQKEVAARLAASPGTKDYGVLSLRVQSCREVSVLRDFGPELFHPAPQVDSTVVLLEPRAADAFAPFDRKRFDGLVRQGFSQRRKKLVNLLRDERERWEEVAAAVGFEESARAEELSLEQWIALTNLLDPDPPAEEDRTGDEVFDVVDESDEVSGQATRREVHERDLRHRAVHLFVFNGKGELFLQKRSHLKDRHPGVWDSSAAGHLDAGEGYEEAAGRELEEELGFAPGAGGLAEVGRLEACEETGWEFIRLYEAQATAKPRWSPTEIEFGAWFPVEVVAGWVEKRPGDFAPGFLKCFASWRGTRG